MNSTFIKRSNVLLGEIQSNKVLREKIFSETSLNKRFDLIKNLGFECTAEDMLKFQHSINVEPEFLKKHGGYCPEYEAHGTCLS